MRLIVAALGFAFAMSACAQQIGTKFDISKADTLTPGASTLEDAVAQLGAPQRTMRRANGNTVAKWSYMLRGTPTGTEATVLEIVFGLDKKMIAITRRYVSSAGRTSTAT